MSRMLIEADVIAWAMAMIGAFTMREPAKSFQDLLVWQKAHSFVLSVYRMTSLFPKHEVYGLSSQFRRAAISIAANIAEGFRKRSKADKMRFFGFAQGSAEECRYYLILSKDLGYHDALEANSLLTEACKLLQAYTDSVSNSEF